MQERFEQSLELLHYLGQLRRTMQELLHQALQRPEKGGRSANELHAIVSDISSKNAVQAAALPQQSMPATQPEMPAAEPAGEPQPPAELTAEYRNQMQAQAQHLSTQAAAPEKAQPALSAAELTAIEQSGQNLSLEQVQQLNAAVDQSLSQDDYQSPLAANFAPDPAPDALQAEPAAAAPAPQPVPQPAPAPVPQPVPQPPADDLPPMPEEFADLPPVEAEIAPEAGDDDDDDDAYLALQEQSADALLFAKAPEAPPQYQTAPHTQAALPPRAECKARLQEPKFRPVTQLPHGSSAPQFAGFKLMTPEDFYPQLPSLSPWYAVLAQLKLKNGPERSALMYADLVQDPGSGSELELNMSAEYQQYFAGSKAKPIIEQALSEYYGRPMTLKLNFTAGAPERAPAELARKALSLEGVKKREELKREPQLMALAAALQENLDDVPLVLYRRDDT